MAFGCPACGSDSVINITLTTQGGDPIAFHSCHSCDRRWWNKDGEQIDLSNVLELAKREPRRAGRAKA